MDDTERRQREQQLTTEREELLDRVVRWLDPPMMVLGLIWLLLVVVDLVGASTPLLNALSTAIWILFLVDFALEFFIAPHKVRYLEANWLAAVSLAAPALRVLRVARLARLLRTARAARGLGLLRIVSSFNRGMRALGATMGRRGFGYIVALTVAVVLLGAAGMYAFERQAPGADVMQTYPGAVWWTAMLVTTMGSGYWPQTGAGEVLCLLLAVYAFAVFGYVTATLASFFVDRDAERDDAAVAGAPALEHLRQELARMREEMTALRSAINSRA